MLAKPTPEHRYLVDKRVLHPYSLRQDGDALLVPLRDVSGTLHSLQTIMPNGEKRFLTGGRVAGCYCGIGEVLSNVAPVLVVCEGYATGATIHDATGYYVACAMNAGNLQAVAQALRTRYPQACIVVAGDDDWRTAGNPGLTAARQAAEAVNGVSRMPRFGDGRPDKATDFNDLEALSGLDEVRDQLTGDRVAGPAIRPSTGFASLEPNPFDYSPAYDQAGAAGDAVAWHELVPLPEDTGEFTPPLPFPFAAMGPILGAAAQAIANDVQAPDGMAGASVLAAASLAVQALADVILPHGQASPLSLYCVTSGSSGDRKSAVDAVACMEILKRRKEQSRLHHHAMEAYLQEQAACKKGDPEPQEPTMQVLTVSNATIEGVSRLLKGQSSIGIFSPEGGEVLGGHSMKEVNRMGAMSFFLKGWSGESLDTMRGGAGYSSLLGRRIALHIMVQPLLLRELLSDPLADGQGFLARCLIAQPSTLAGSRLYRGDNPMENPAVLVYAERMGRLLDTKPELWPNGDGYELKPKGLPLSPDARALWIAFYNAIEQEQADSKELAQARAFASKAAEQAARIAGIIAIFEDPNAVAIDLAAMDGAMELVNFYLSEHLRLMGTGKQEQTDKRLRVLWEWLQGQGPVVNAALVLQKSPRLIRNLKAKGIGLLLEDLAQRGYIRAVGKAWEVRRDA